MPEWTRPCRDVVGITALHARFVRCGSAYGGRFAEACVETYESCADACEHHDADHCQVGSDVPWECDERCRNVAA